MYFKFRFSLFPSVELKVTHDKFNDPQKVKSLTILPVFSLSGSDK